MLSISAMANGQGNYYASLAVRDYYHEGGEPPGYWLGKGAELMKLQGEVDRDAFLNLFAGFSADGRESLVQAHPRRQPGWDLTFSAPKSVSVLWAMGDFELRKEVAGAHRKAVQAAVDYLERSAAFTRRGKGGATREALPGLIIAAFDHGTSRAEDPQLHTHAILLNAAPRMDGTTGTVVSRTLFSHKMAGGALYRAELARELMLLGYSLERAPTAFAVKGVPKELCEEFSKRRQAIEDELKASKETGAKASERAALKTRGFKQHAPRAELLEEWRSVAKEYGFVSAEVKRHPRERLPECTEAQAGTVLQELMRLDAHFRAQDYVRKTAEELLLKGVGGRSVEQVVGEALSRNGDIVALQQKRLAQGEWEDGSPPKDPPEPRYSTRAMLALEQHMLEVASELKQASLHPVAKKDVESSVAKRPTLKKEQKDALEHVLEKPGDLQCVVGLAGTGKTFLLHAAREVWEKSGYRVHGFALAARAAGQLRDGANIESMTLAKLFTLEAMGKHTITKKSVLVLDEAGMVGTKQMARFMEIAKEREAKVVLVGDTQQLQPIEAGGPFRALVERHDAAKLSNITRQREEWERTAVLSLAEGDAVTALSLYAEHGRLKVEETKSKALSELVSDWNKERTKDLKDTLVLAGTREDVRALNERIQAERQALGETKGRVLALGEPLYIGDRVVFTKNDKSMKVVNGEFGTVEAQLGFGVLVRMDRQTKALLPMSERVLVPQAKLPTHVSRGYAITTHKAQGATIEKAFVLAGGWMQDRHLSYVQMSRARGETKLYAPEGAVREDVPELLDAMKRSREKDIAMDAMQRQF